MKIQKIQNYISNNFPESEEKSLNLQSLSLKRNKIHVSSVRNLDMKGLGSNLNNIQNIRGI